MTTFNEKIQTRFYEQLNSHYYAIENESYKAQKMVMKLYHYFKHFGMTLKEAWGHVKSYFEPIAEVHTCRELPRPRYYGQKAGQYTGD